MNISLRNIGVVIGIIAVAALTGHFTGRTVVVSQYGASGSPDVQTYLNVAGVLTAGGGVFATSSAGTVTYGGSDLSAGVVEHNATGAVTATLPASTTIASINAAGQSRTIFFKNTGTANLTIAAGTGTLLKFASTTGTAIATGLINSGDTARLDFFRKSNSDIEVVMTPAS